MKKLILLAIVFVCSLSVRADALKQAVLATDFEFPLTIGGKRVGSACLKAGSSVCVVKVQDDGVLISRGETDPVKVSKEVLTPESIVLASTTPSPIPSLQSTPTSEKPIILSVINSVIEPVISKDQINSTTISPVECWTFTNNKINNIGRSRGSIVGKVSFQKDSLKLDGGGYFISEPLKEDINEKTFEIKLVITNGMKNYLGAMLIRSLNKSSESFDGFDFAYLNPLKWNTSSENAVRSSSLGGATETDFDRPIHIAVTYEKTGKITFYRNGDKYGASYTPKHDLERYNAGKALVVLGAGYYPPTNKYINFFRGRIQMAAIYDKALTPTEVKSIYFKSCDSSDISSASLPVPKPVSPTEFLPASIKPINRTNALITSTISNQSDINNSNQISQPADKEKNSGYSYFYLVGKWEPAVQHAEPGSAIQKQSVEFTRDKYFYWTFSNGGNDATTTTTYKYQVIIEDNKIKMLNDKANYGFAGKIYEISLPYNPDLLSVSYVTKHTPLEADVVQSSSGTLTLKRVEP